MATSAPVTAASGRDSAPTGMFAPLRTRSYLRLWLGSGVVSLAVMAQGVARGWLAFRLTGSNAALGGVLLAFGLAMLIATPLGGVVGDRWPKRLVLQMSIALLALTSAWIGLAIVFDVIAYWMLIVASALQAIAFALYSPARMAFISDLVPSKEVPEALALMLISGEASRVAGPAIGGVVIGGLTYGLQAVFFASAALFVGGLVAGLGLPAGRRLDVGPVESPLTELRDGVRYVRERKSLTLLMGCTFGVIMIGLPYLAFLPTVADRLFHVGSAGYGVLSASSAVGAVAAGFTVNRLRRRLGPWRLVVASGTLFGVGILALSLAPTYWVAVVVLVPVGAGLLVFQTANQALLMALSDVTFHGRIQGLVMLSLGGFGLVALPLGALADLIGLRPTFAGMGVGVLLVVAVFAVRSRRQWDQSRLLDLG